MNINSPVFKEQRKTDAAKESENECGTENRLEQKPECTA